MFMYFQGFKDHKLYDPLENPGSADLTADVDFSYLKRCCGEDGNAVLTLIYNSHFNEAYRLSKLFEILVPLFILVFDDVLVEPTETVLIPAPVP